MTKMVRAKIASRGTGPKSRRGPDAALTWIKDDTAQGSFKTCEDAETFIAEARGDDPELRHHA